MVEYMSSSTEQILPDKFQVNVDTVCFSVTEVQIGADAATKSLITDSNGEYLGEITNRTAIAGSHGRHALQYRVKSRSPHDHELFVEGSPFANKYGQNVWTSGNVKLACTSTLRRLIPKLNIRAMPASIEAWKEGNIALHRVDLAVNFRLESSQQVDEALTQLKRQIIAMRCQCSVHVRYVALRPRRGTQYSIAIYDKGDQMSMNSRRSEADMLFQRLVNECQGILRIEVRLRRAELKKLGLTLAGDWKTDTARDVFRKYFARLPLQDVTFGTLSAADFRGISERMRPVLALHKLNADWKPIYSERTRTRHKAYFKERGINLDCPNAIEVPVSLAGVLSKPGAIAGTPMWLIKAGMAPRRKRKAGLREPPR
jgi:hypothetical protein